jgi:hypothetical protein
MKTAEQRTNAQDKLIRIFSMTILILMFGASCRQSAQAQAPGAPPVSVYTNAEEFSDEQGVEVQSDFTREVNDMLKARRFNELDELAKTLRTRKAKWPGSRWKLMDFYIGLQEPSPKMHSTEEDWATHLKLLNEWVAAKPKSITPRVALAGAYSAYGWHARGSQTSETVTDSGWRLLGDRLARARTILKDAKKLDEKCPHWYATMQYVAQGESWSPSQARALFDEAVAFEPMYYEYYHNMADYLLPRWHGEPGDTEKFAEAAANRMGGAEGDVLYFQIGWAQTCHCDNQDVLKAMSWTRIQKGFAESERLYGKSLMRINQIAYMATKLKDIDILVADDAFRRMGDRWSDVTWTKQSYFEQWRDWVAQMAPGLRYIANVKLEAKKNMETAEGQRYKDEVAKRFAGYAKECAAKVPAPLPTLHVMFVVKADGTPAGMQVEPDTPFGNCMRTISYDHRTEKFSAAPKDAYWVTWEIDPKTVQ